MEHMPTVLLRQHGPYTRCRCDLKYGPVVAADPPSPVLVGGLPAAQQANARGTSGAAVTARPARTRRHQPWPAGLRRLACSPSPSSARDRLHRWLVSSLPVSPRSRFTQPFCSPSLPARAPSAPGALPATACAAARLDRKSTRLNSSHSKQSRMPSSA